MGTSPAAATAAAVNREGAKYRAHANPTHTNTSPPYMEYGRPRKKTYDGLVEQGNKPKKRKTSRKQA